MAICGRLLCHSDTLLIIRLSIKDASTFFRFILKVILANVQAMRRTLEEMERCKAELRLPQGAEESLLVFSRVGQLLKDLDELEHLTEQQAKLLEVEPSPKALAIHDRKIKEFEKSLQRNIILCTTVPNIKLKKHFPGFFFYLKMID